MHLVFFQFVQHHGGASRSCIEFARRLSKYIDVSIIDPYGCDPNYVNAVQQAEIDFHVLKPGRNRSYIGGHGNILKRMLNISKSIPDFIDLQIRTKRIIQKLKPDIICCDNIKSAFLIASTPGLRNIPLIPFLRGWYLPVMLPKYGLWVCKNRAVSVIAVSQATRAALMASGIDYNKVKVLHNPIDSESITKLSEQPLQAELPMLGNEIRILLPASIVREKGQHTAIQAVKILADKGLDPVLWIAGDHVKFDRNNAYIDELKMTAENLGISERIVYLGLRNDIPAVMKHSSIVILPSHFEGHPRVILEAMALGKPIAASPAGGIMDMIIDNLTGRLFDIDDAKGLAECISDMQENQELTTKMAKTAQDYVCNFFKPDIHTQKALEIFDTAIKNFRKQHQPT